VGAAEGSEKNEIVDPLKQVRFALTVPADDDGPLIRQLEIQSGDVAKVPNGEVGQTHVETALIRAELSHSRQSGINTTGFKKNYGTP
jgi:hypothetical protein